MSTQTCPSPQETETSVTRARAEPSSAAELRPEEQQLLVENLNLVRIAVAQVRRRLPAHVDADDLHSAGVLGLIAAIRRCDQAMADRFQGFALHRIRGAILDELRRMDCCSRRMRATLRELEQVKQDLEQKLQRAATTDEMRLALGLSVAEYRRRVATARPVKLMSLDHEPETADGPGKTLHTFLADTADETGFDRLQQSDRREILARLMASLPEMPRKILALHYHEGLSFVEIAVVFRRSAARICQIHRRTITTLRRQLRHALES